MGNFDSFLSHAVKQPYDPVARRERYLRERQLKGRTTGGGTTPSTRARPKKEAPKKKPKTAQEKAVASAQKRIEAIGQKLQDWLETQRINDATKSRQMSEAARAKIDALPEIPKWVTPATRERLLRARRAEIARIAGDVREDREALNEQTSDRYKEKAKQAQVQREKVAKDLKAAIEKIRKSAASGR